MAKRLIIKNSDFSENSLAVIADKDITLPLIASSINKPYQRCGLSLIENDGRFRLFKSSIGISWRTYIADVSTFVGRTVKVKYSNGYSEYIKANGAFLSTSAPTFKNNWTAIDDNDFYKYVLQPICPVTEVESNVEIAKTYAVPQGAKWLMWSSKTTGEVIVLAE